jgi:hypothetical protein
LTTGTTTDGGANSGTTWSAPCRAVPVTPAIVARQQLVEVRHKVQVGPGAELHDHQSGRRVRDKDRKQAIALACDESGALWREVEHAAPVAGGYVQLLMLHVVAPS